MDYASVSEARHMPGLRLVLTAGVPGPWGEAIKSVLHHKGLDYVAVTQEAGEENPELVDWTGQRSAQSNIGQLANRRVSQSRLEIVLRHGHQGCDKNRCCSQVGQPETYAGFA